MADRRIAALTTGRQDYGILRSTLVALRDAADFTPLVIAGGMHCSASFGRTIDLVRADGFEIAAELDFLADPPDAPGDASRALAMTSDAIGRLVPEALVLVGDRHETAAAGIAAVLAGVPIVHMHGGEETEGAVDNVFRHALTKMSHLHLVSHEAHAERVIQMGEAPEDVVVVGPPGVDNAFRDDLPGRPELEARVGMPLEDPVVIVTVHPVTLGDGDSLRDLHAVANAMEAVAARYVVTLPNADHGNEAIRTFWREWCSGRRDVVAVEALGERNYWGLLRLAKTVLGNSSSGLIEAPALGVAAVNVGDRQRGRLRWPAVRDVPSDAEAVTEALAAAIREPAPRGMLADGPAAPRIMAALRAWTPPRPPRKAFRSLAWT